MATLTFSSMLALAALAVALLVLRILLAIRQTHAGQRRAKPQDKANAHGKQRLTVFLGSGGHTGEMMRLVNALDFSRHALRLYVVSSGDSLSLAKVAELEASKADSKGQKSSAWSATQIPRARRVHQSFLTAPFTTLQCFWTCFRLFTLPSFISTKGKTDLILLNGPGSCVPIVVAAFLPRIFNLHSPLVIYVESLARVTRLSLSGKILQFLVDRFLVQWEPLADDAKSVHGFRAKREYLGILV